MNNKSNPNGAIGGSLPCWLRLRLEFINMVFDQYGI
jgi:hypothetical protein